MNPERAEFGRALSLLAVALGFELDEPTIAVHWHALRSVPVEIRRQAFARASERRWFKFPQPAELKGLAADVVDEQRAVTARQARALMADCPDCQNSPGWRSDGRAVVRCACHVRAVALLAGQPATIARPALTEGME